MCDGCEHEKECKEQVCLYDFYEKGVNDGRIKAINEVIKYISTHIYGWQDLRDFLEEMKGGKG